MLTNTCYCFGISLFFMIHSVNALHCYTCTYLSDGLDNSCVLDPESTHQITNCSKQYCIIVRQELVYLNAVKTDTTFKTYYRSCTSDLCNDSDGRYAATNADPNFGASENTIIKGKLPYYRAKANKN
uniref:UPAR/Ly6 domain-containing protein n=1 Tax=Glossina brevipalpis TaxID=37001 RepID=A0A1A9W2F4_9MUSC